MEKREGPVAADLAAPPAPQPESPRCPPCSPQAAKPLRHQVHHSYIWLGGARVAFLILFAATCSSISAIPGLIALGDTPLAAGMSVALFVLLCAAAAFAVTLGAVLLIRHVGYRHLWYELGAEEFSLYSGIFNKKRTHVPYRRVQSVDQRSSLLQRVFGVCTVAIDTAGGASNKAVLIPYVRKSQAEELRRDLFLRKQLQEAAQNGAVLHQSGGNVLDIPAEVWNDVRGVFAGERVDTGAVSYEYGLTNKELLLTGLSNNTAFFLVLLGILGGIAQFVGNVAPLVFGAAQPVMDSVVSSGAQLLGSGIVALGVVSVVAAALVMWVFSAVGTCLSYGGFHARRRGSRIEVEHGLLQHSFQGIDVGRVQSVTVKQSFIRRLMGYCEISVGKVDAASQNAGDQQKSGLGTQGVVIHPFVKMSRVPEILAGIIPEFAGVPAEGRSVPRVALRRAIVRRAVLQGEGFWLAVAATAALAVMGVLSGSVYHIDAVLLNALPKVAAIVYALAFVLVAVDCAGAVLWFRSSSFAFNERFMQVSNGGFSRETTSIPRTKVQYGWTRTNPFQRRAHTATVCVRTAAGVGGTTARLIDACEEDACMWLNWLKPHGLPCENVLK